MKFFVKFDEEEFFKNNLIEIIKSDEMKFFFKIKNLLNSEKFKDYHFFLQLDHQGKPKQFARCSIFIFLQLIET